VWSGGHDSQFSLYTCGVVGLSHNFHSTRVEWLTYVTVGAGVSFGLEILKNDTSAISIRLQYQVSWKTLV